MVLRSLLVCRDPETLRVFRRALRDLEIEGEEATAASSALESLDSNKFDVIIVDCDTLAGGTDVLTGIQRSRSNKRAITIAVINGTTNMRAAFEMGARLALDKPVTVERAARSLRAAHSFMVSEQHRYFRCVVDTKAYLSFGVVKQLPGTVTNVSAGGMALTLREQTSLSWVVDVRFDLPGIREALDVKGEFAWSDDKGKAGIRFTYVPIDSKRWLGKWLSQRIEEGETSRTPGKANGRRSVTI